MAQIEWQWPNFTDNGHQDLPHSNGYLVLIANLGVT